MKVLILGEEKLFAKDVEDTNQFSEDNKILEDAFNRLLLSEGLMDCSIARNRVRFCPDQLKDMQQEE